MPSCGFVFDFDGTICLSESVHMDAWVVTARRLRLPLPDGFVDQGVGVADATLADQLARLWNGTLPAAEILHLKCEEFRSRDAREFPLVSGVIRFMQAAKARGIPLALATSSSMQDIKPIFNNWSLEQYFSSVFTIESVTKAKPEPEVYLKAADSLGLKPGEVFVFEDSLPGVQSARAAGCKVVGIGTTYGRDELGDVVAYITSFDDADNILSKLLQESV